MNRSQLEALFQDSLDKHIRALRKVADRDRSGFAEAVERITSCSGKVVFTGVGKSGHAARLVASVFCSVGLPSVFVQASEALHGDLGLIESGDVVIAVSNSARTNATLRVIEYARDKGAWTIGIFGGGQDAIGIVDTRIDATVASVDEFFPPMPTSSTVVAVTIGHALACATIADTGFNYSQYARIHPGGDIGRKLNREKNGHDG